MKTFYKSRKKTIKTFYKSIPYSMFLNEFFLRRLGMNKRFGDRSISLLQDESDGALSAPEMPSIRRDRGKCYQHTVLTLDSISFTFFLRFLSNCSRDID